MSWRFYCPCCKKIINRFQVAKGTDRVRFYWHRCRQCGTQVLELKYVLEQTIASTRRVVDDDKGK